MRKLQRAPEEALNTQDADKSGGKAFFAAHKQRLRKANTADAGKPGIHESAIKHVTGTATYVDDIPELPNTLHLAAGGSAYANAAIVDMNLDPVRTSEGVIGVFTHNDVPGHIDIAPVFTGDPLLIQERSQFLGQPLFFVAATSYHQALLAAQKAQVEYDIDEPVVRLKDALAKGDTVLPEHVMSSGDSVKAISNAAHQLAGSGYMRGQEHLYLEGQVAYAQPTEDGGMHVFTSSQHPSEVQKLVAEVLAIGAHLVTAEVRRMGGGFGGKESQAAAVACAAALAAWHLQRPVKYRMPRRQDMETTGKRHDFQFDYRIGFSANGVITGTEIELAGLCGCSADLSQGIVDRAMFHADNAYSLGAANVVGKAPRTHTVSNTAFRGFGGPKGMVAIETMMDDIARTLGEDPLAIRKRNLYRADANTTHYGQPVEFEPIHEIMGRLEQTSDYWHRRSEITEFNQANRWVKKGLALTPVKFGISFTSSHLNQAGALVHVYTDGTILVNHGGTEMGQGLYTKIAQLVANCFGVSSDYVHVTSTRTDKIANTSPTAASSGTDLNGYAAHNACEQIVAALTEFAAEQFAVATDQVQFNDNQVRVGEKSFGFAEFCKLAYMHRVPLMAHGFYKTPKIHYDRASGSGHPFFYFANGAACAEVLVDCLTGEYKVQQVDILHDVGRSINPALDIGQVEGGFIQGMGWLTSEELLWDDNGRVISNGPANYKIPTAFDVPRIFNVALYQRPNSEQTVFNSKAVGEPPLMLAISVWAALRDACASVANYTVSPRLDPPATPEAVLNAIKQCQQASGGAS